jgi:hypothetical protein
MRNVFEILLLLFLFKLADRYGVGRVLWSCAALSTVVSVVVFLGMLWWR